MKRTREIEEVRAFFAIRDQESGIRDQMR